MPDRSRAQHNFTLRLFVVIAFVCGGLLASLGHTPAWVFGPVALGGYAYSIAAAFWESRRTRARSDL